MPLDTIFQTYKTLFLIHKSLKTFKIFLYMKKFVLLFLVIILLINTVYALEVDFSCPEVVFVNEEFICLLQADNFEGVYDVKVDISVENNNLAEIWDGDWKSGRYYLNGFLDDKNEKEIRLIVVKDFDGEVNGILKLRKEGKVESFDFVIEIENEKDFLDKDVLDEEIVSEKEVVEIIKLSDSKDSVAITEDIKTNKIIIYESKNEKIKKYSVFGFALLCVGLSVLIIFKKL